VHATTPTDRFGPISYREYTTYRDRDRTLSGLTAEKYQFFAEQDRNNEQARSLWGDPAGNGGVWRLV
jgi:hypothetical protein